MYTPKPLLSIGAKLTIPPHIPSRERQTGESSPRNINTTHNNNTSGGIGLSSSWNGTLSIPKSNQPPPNRNGSSLLLRETSSTPQVSMPSDRDHGGVLDNSLRLNRSGHAPSSFTFGAHTEFGRSGDAMNPDESPAASPRNSYNHHRVLRTVSAVARKPTTDQCLPSREAPQRNETDFGFTRTNSSLCPQHVSDPPPPPRALTLLQSLTELELVVTGVEEPHPTKRCAVALWIEGAKREIKHRQDNGRRARQCDDDTVGKDDTAVRDEARDGSCLTPNIGTDGSGGLLAASRLSTLRLKLVDRCDVGQPAALSHWIREAWVYRALFPPGAEIRHIEFAQSNSGGNDNA